MTPYASAAEKYRAAGWPAPLPAGNKPLEKWPPPKGFTGWDGRWPDDDQISKWITARGDRNIGLRVPVDVVGLDVDSYKGESETETMIAVSEAHGRLPRTWVTTSRTDGSGIRLFRLPGDVDPKDLAGNIDHPTDEDRTAGEVIRYGHRYAVVWPSVHPDTGETYRWRHQETGESRIPQPSELPELTLEWVDHLRRDCSCYAASNIWVRYESKDPVRSAFEKWHGKLISGTYSRHEAAAGGSMALVAFQLWEGAEEYLQKLEDSFIASVTADRSRTPGEAQAEWQRLVEGAEKKVTPIPRPESRAQQQTRPSLSSPERLPDELWTARPALSHIREAAWSRGRSADAVLVSVLARIAADTPHTVRLPGIVGAPCGLTLIAAISGPPGTGKSTAARIANELLPARVISPESDGVPPGSGEGFIELLFDWVKEQDPDTDKTIRVHRQVRHNAFMYVDEGEVLTKLAGRQSGSTLLPLLRTAFTSGVLGQANASQDRKRIIPPGQAVYGVVLGIQPGLAGPLFDEAAAGTPQRILWASTTTPTPEPDARPEWPGVLDRPTIAPDSWRVHQVTDTYNQHHIGVPSRVRDEVAYRDHQRQLNGSAHLDEHRDLIQLKVSGVLAILDGRLDIEVEDWQLAEQIVETSAQVRDGLSDRLQAEANEREQATARRLAQRRVEADRRSTEYQIVDTAKYLTKRVTDHPGEFTPGKLKNRSSTKRKEIFEDALDHAMSQQWVVERVEPGQGEDKRRLHPGEERP